MVDQCEICGKAATWFSNDGMKLCDTHHKWVGTRKLGLRLQLDTRNRRGFKETVSRMYSRRENRERKKAELGSTLRWVT